MVTLNLHNCESGRNPRGSLKPEYLEKTTVCQTCGDKGEVRLLIYCVQCQDSAVHHYCLEKFSVDDDNITWKCEECAPLVAKVGPAEKREQISLKNDLAFEGRKNGKKRLKKINSSKAKGASYLKEENAKTTRLDGDCSPSNEAMTHLQSNDETRGSHELKKRKMFPLEDMGNGEDSESLTADTSSVATHGHREPWDVVYEPSVKCNEYVHAQPLIQPIWRGTCAITSETKDTIVGLMAHLSSKACSKVYDAATSLPPVLHLEMLPKIDIWPKGFRKSSPTDESIALFFFPEFEREERVFDVLLDKIFDHNLALKAIINDVDLLVFSSIELPQQYWRFRRKYYLWGVFRQNQSSRALVPVEDPVVLDTNAACVASLEYTNETGSQGFRMKEHGCELQDP